MTVVARVSAVGDATWMRTWLRAGGWAATPPGSGARRHAVVLEDLAEAVGVPCGLAVVDVGPGRAARLVGLTGTDGSPPGRLFDRLLAAAADTARRLGAQRLDAAPPPADAERLAMSGFVPGLGPEVSMIL